MSQYLVSRGWHTAQVIEVTADTPEEAIEEAKQSADGWRSCVDDDEVFYQIEGEIESVTQSIAK